MTRTIQALLDHELIERVPDPLDGRVSWLSITPEGRKLLQRSRRRTDEFLAKRVKRLDPGDRAVLDRAADLLERLAQGRRRGRGCWMPGIASSALRGARGTSVCS